MFYKPRCSDSDSHRRSPEPSRLPQICGRIARIPLSQNRFAIIDAAEADLAARWVGAFARHRHEDSGELNIFAKYFGRRSRPHFGMTPALELDRCFARSRS